MDRDFCFLLKKNHAPDRRTRQMVLLERLLVVFVPLAVEACVSLLYTAVPLGLITSAASLVDPRDGWGLVSRHI